MQLPADVAVLEQPQGAMQGADKRVTVKETDKVLGGGQCRSGLNRFAALSADSDEEPTTDGSYEGCWGGLCEPCDGG